VPGDFARAYVPGIGPGSLYHTLGLPTASSLLFLRSFLWLFAESFTARSLIATRYDTYLVHPRRFCAVFVIDFVVLLFLFLFLLLAVVVDFVDVVAC